MKKNKPINVRFDELEIAEVSKAIETLKFSDKSEYIRFLHRTFYPIIAQLNKPTTNDERKTLLEKITMCPNCNKSIGLNLKCPNCG